MGDSCPACTPPQKSCFVRIRAKTLLKLLAAFLQDSLRTLRLGVEFYYHFLVGGVTILSGPLTTGSLNRTDLFLTGKESYSLDSSLFFLSVLHPYEWWHLHLNNGMRKVIFLLKHCKIDLLGISCCVSGEKQHSTAVGQSLIYYQNKASFKNNKIYQICKLNFTE